MLRKHKIKFIFLLATLMSLWTVFLSFAAKCSNPTGHVYISTGCQEKCMFCGATRGTAHHNYIPKSEGASGHRWRCIICNAVKSGSKTEAHVFKYTYEGNGKHSRRCVVCDYPGTDQKCTTYDTVTKEPTYTSTGTKTTTCMYCYHEETVTIPKLTCTHSWSAWQNKGGNHQRTCSTCKTTQTGDHQWGAWKDNGTTHVRTCSVCGKQESGNHSNDGTGKCGTCGKTMHVHDHNKLVETIKAPSCTENGKGKYGCSAGDGGDTVEKVIPKLNHSYGNEYKLDNATCTEDGHWAKDCVRGDHTMITRTETKLGHNWQEKWFSENGVPNSYKKLVCSRCGLEKDERTYTTHTVTYMRVDKDNNIELERQTRSYNRGQYAKGSDIGTENIVHDGITYFYDSCDKVLVNGEVTVKAYYRKLEYRVDYDPNGGTGQMGSQTIKYDAEFTLLPNQFTRTGYTFKGWSKNQTGSVMYTDQQKITNLIKRTETGNTVKLYAVWEANKYTVHFTNTKGIDVADIVVTYDQPYGTLPDLKTDTEMLRSWTMEVPRGTTTGIEDIDPTTIVKTASDHTLIADWKYLAWKVKFLSPSTSMVLEVRNNETTYPPFDPSEVGMRFLRWSEKPNGEEAFDFNTKITEDKSLYAVFEYRTFTITLVGTGTQDRLYPTTIGTLPDGYQKGSTFGGWYYDTDLTQKVNSTDNMPPRDITVYPKYTIGQYKLTLKGYQDNYTLRYGDNIPTLPTPKETGKTFVGWKYQTDYVNSGDLFEWDHDVELEPIWDTNRFTVAYPDGNIKTVSYGDVIGELPAAPMKSGSTFVGYVNQKGEYVTESTQVFENTTINWKYENSKLVLHLVDDDWSTNVQVEAGVTVTNLPTRSKEGYGFKGWSTYVNGPATHGPFYQNMTLYASYEAGMQNIILSDLNQTIQRKVGSELGNLPSASKEGFRFDGWTNNGNLVDSSTIVPPGGMTLVAKFTPMNVDRTDTVVIRYYSDGVRINSVDLARGDILYNPGNPAVSAVETRHFVYWADENGREYQFGHTVGADLNLYAVWR